MDHARERSKRKTLPNAGRSRLWLSWAQCYFRFCWGRCLVLNRPQTLLSGKTSESEKVANTPRIAQRHPGSYPCLYDYQFLHITFVWHSGGVDSMCHLTGLRGVQIGQFLGVPTWPFQDEISTPPLWTELSASCLWSRAYTDCFSHHSPPPSTSCSQAFRLELKVKLLC